MAKKRKRRSSRRGNPIDPRLFDHLSDIVGKMEVLNEKCIKLASHLSGSLRKKVNHIANVLSDESEDLAQLMDEIDELG